MDDTCRRRLSFAALEFAALLVVIGCEENLASREHFEVPFSMYGVLSPDLGSQSIRVYPLEDFPTLGSLQPLDADVFSTDLETGERLAWRDTILVDSNGQHEYVFWAPFRAEFGHEYRVEVIRRADAARSFAQVRIPEPVTVSIVDEQGPTIDVLIEGEGIRVLTPEVVYTVAINPGCHFLRNRFSYQGRERRLENGWQVNVNMIIDQSNIIYGCSGVTIIATGRCPQFLLQALDLHLLVGDVMWEPPGGIFDPNLLPEPHTMTNVENGYGFIGAGYRLVAPLYPSKEALRVACLADGLGPRPD